MTQREIVIDKLLSDGHISRNWCLERRITRLEAIICDLNSDKWEIAGGWQKTDHGRDYIYRLVNALLKRLPTEWTELSLPPDMNLKLIKMISYETAKKLKEAGWPQVFGEGEFLEGVVESDEGGIVTTNSVYFPTLSELIEACGKVTVVLWGCKNHGYYASSQPCGQEICELDGILVGTNDGSIPEEAVAALWLKLKANK